MALARITGIWCIGFGGKVCFGLRVLTCTSRSLARWPEFNTWLATRQ